LQFHELVVVNIESTQFIIMTNNNKLSRPHWSRLDACPSATREGKNFNTHCWAAVVKGINTNFVEDEPDVFNKILIIVVAMFGTWVSAVFALCFRFHSYLRNFYAILNSVNILCFCMHASWYLHEIVM
jgi:hypothetical protein